MRMIKKKAKRLNQKGFSLIEVLLAIAILALVAAPILQMFYSSYAINQRSRKYLAAADLAQTVMEAFSAQTWETSETVLKDAEGNPISVPGVKDTYYVDGSILDAMTNVKKLYAVPYNEGGSAAPDVRLMLRYTPNPLPEEKGPFNNSDTREYFLVGPSTTDSDGNTVEQGIKYAGYDFSAIVYFDFTNSKSGDEFYTVGVKIDIYEYEKGNEFNKLIESVSTQIPNKR